MGTKSKICEHEFQRDRLEFFQFFMVNFSFNIRQNLPNQL